MWANGPAARAAASVRRWRGPCGADGPAARGAPVAGRTGGGPLRHAGAPLRAAPGSSIRPKESVGLRRSWAEKKRARIRSGSHS